MRFNYLVSYSYLFVMIMLFDIGYIQSSDQTIQKVETAAKKLNALIAKYQQKSSLQLVDQAFFVQTLTEFQQYLDQLNKAGDDVTEYQTKYLEVYYQWASVVVTNQDLVKQLDEQFIPEQDAQFNQQRVLKLEEIYEAMYKKLSDAQNLFNTQVAAKIGDLGAYSIAEEQAFVKFLRDEFQSFNAAVKVAAMNAKGGYWAFLEKHDRVTDLANMDTAEKDFFQKIDVLAQDSIICIRAFMLDITSQSVRNRAIGEISQAFASSELEAQKIYQQQLANNQQGLGKTWWEALKHAGLDLLKDFHAEFKKELAKQTQKIIIEQGGKVVGSLGQSIAQMVKNMSPELAAKMNQLTDKLKSENFTKFLNSTDTAKLVLLWTIRSLNPVIPPATAIKVSTKLDLSVEEKTFIKNRLAKVGQVLKNEFQITEPLRIGFCCSGGGIRAMIGTLGILTAAARSKILQASMYVAGLSGSTWLIGPWSYLYLQNKFKDAQGKPIEDYEQTLSAIRENWKISLNNPSMIPAASGMFIPSVPTGQQGFAFSNQIAIRLAYENKLSAVDLYGGMVGNIVLDAAGSDRLSVKWSSIAQAAQKGEIPLPLCSNAFDVGHVQKKVTGVHTHYEWLETSPFQAGSPVLGYIPIQYFGSTFKGGALDMTQSKNLRPEYPLSFYLGTYGSAFSLSLNDVVDKGLSITKVRISPSTEVAVPVDVWMKDVIDAELGAQARGAKSKYIVAHLSNFSAEVPTSSLPNKEWIGIFDAGISYNLPLPLLLDRPERAIDIIIMYDSNPGDENTLKNAAVYYDDAKSPRKKNISIPDLSKVTKKDLASRVMTVFNDPRDPKDPNKLNLKYNAKQSTFIYFPTRQTMAVPIAGSWPASKNDIENVKTAQKTFDNSKVPYLTSNFKYTPEQMGDLVDAVDYAFTSQVSEIEQIMKLVAKARRS